MIRASFFFILFFASVSLYGTPPKELGKKSVIFLIGDGMGPQQVSMLYYFAKYASQSVVKSDAFSFEKIAKEGSLAFSTTEPFDHIVVDSACSATQLALGRSSRPEMVGLDKDGNEQLNVLEKAKALNWKTGIISDTRITHATPASFFAHEGRRQEEDQIAPQILKLEPDVALSGGLNYFLPQGFQGRIGNIDVVSQRKDTLNVLEAAKKKFRVVHDRFELKKESAGKMLGLFSAEQMPNGIWQSQNKNKTDRKIPSLLEMTQAAVNHLNKGPQSFFLMVEGGQIDWAGHQNDAGLMLHELIQFNETLNWLIDWVKKHPETLLVVTADHETGGFGFSYNGFEVPGPQKLKGKAFSDREYQASQNYGNYQNLNILYEQKKALVDIWREFKALPKKQETVSSLQAMIKKETSFEMSEQEAVAVISAKKDFYHSKENAKTAAMARAMGPTRNTVWATGSHTATPVYVFALGGKGYHQNFKGMLNHRQLGNLLQQFLK